MTQEPEFSHWTGVLGVQWKNTPAVEASKDLRLDFSRSVFHMSMSESASNQLVAPVLQSWPWIACTQTNWLHPTMQTNYNRVVPLPRERAAPTGAIHSVGSIAQEVGGSGP